jgi:hypothetical protein
MKPKTKTGINPKEGDGNMAKVQYEATGVMAKINDQELEIHLRREAKPGRGRPSKYVKKGGKWTKLSTIKGAEYQKSAWVRKDGVDSTETPTGEEATA